ncbi:hypothetical protein [Nocardia suismassiliense]|uniref:hypothetical protein n=1 Tax=Nocardia suismassiliense TaxID=2077092 RepID=UPI00131F2F95|nr:hypothetical protein [Nocardia suismassiliense]
MTTRLAAAAVLAATAAAFVAFASVTATAAPTCTGGKDNFCIEIIGGKEGRPRATFTGGGLNRWNVYYTVRDATGALVGDDVIQMIRANEKTLYINGNSNRYVLSAYACGGMLAKVCSHEISTSWTRP